MYSKMKGKYFARSIHEKNSSLIVTTRQIQALLADERHRSKGSNKSKVPFIRFPENNNWNE